MKKQHKRLWALALCLALLMTLPGRAWAATMAEIEAEQARLEQEASDLEDKLVALRDDEAQKLEYQQTLQQKIEVVQEQIDAARRDIDDLNARINELTLKLEKSQEEIQSTIDQFKERLKALYKAGDVGTLQILLDSNSFSDFTVRSEMVRAVTVHDQQLMDKIKEYKENTQAERDENEAAKNKVAELKKQLETQQDELDALYLENRAAIAALEDAQEATENALEKNAEEREANDAAMQALIEEQRRREEEARAAAEAARQAAQSSGSDYGWNNGGEYLGENVSYPTGGGGVDGFNPIWPLPGVSYISAGYGGYPGHRGLDIAGPYGTPVVAAESGTVIAANNYDSWGDSWGYYVLIYHNSTFTTRYAHLSSVAVYNGQYVTAGEIVGYEGATGNVTGPHLHFEVYQNGTRVDPMNFL